MVGGGPKQSEEIRFSGVCRFRQRICAGPARYPSAPEQKGFYARRLDRRRVRQLPHVVRKANPRADQGVGSGAGVESTEVEAVRPNRAAAEVGSALGRV